MKISIEDIKRRQRFLNTSVIPYDNPVLFSESGIDVDNIRNWLSLNEDSNIAFLQALDLMEDAVVENKSNKNIAIFLAENVDKVRDVNQLQNSIKYRNARLKTKISTKIKKRHGSVTDAIQSSIAKINNTLKTASHDNAPKVDDNQQQQQETQEAMNTLVEYYDIINESVKKSCEIDRIMRNYRRVSRHFNLDGIVSNIYNESDIYPAAYGVACCVNTFRSPFKNKYNTALECAWYLFNENHINADDRTIVNAVTDCFLIDSAITEIDVEDIKAVIDNNEVFDKDAFEDIMYMQALANEDTSIDKVEWGDLDEDFGIMEEGAHAYLEDSLRKTITNKENDVKHFFKGVRKDERAVKKMIKRNAKNGNPEELKDQEVKQMIATFRDDCLKNKDKTKNIFSFKSMIISAYAKSPEQIVDEVPNIFGILRAGFVVGATAINPILGVLTLITDYCIKMDLSRKQCEKILKAYDSEIEAVKKKIDKCKDEEQKEKYTKYKEELIKDAKKIHEYEMNLHSEEENDERDAYSYTPGGEDEDLGDFNFDFGDDEWETDWEEGVINLAGALVLAKEVEKLHEGLIDDNLDGMVCDNIFKFTPDALGDIADFVVTVTVMLEENKLLETYDNLRTVLRNDQNKDAVDYMRIDAINEAMYKIQSAHPYEPVHSIKGLIAATKFLQEASNPEYLVELNLTNNLKVAMKNLKRDAIKLSDKEKKLSNNIDVSVNQVTKGIETAMMNNNREAVIKGSIIPSASKTIKMALITGAAWAINPAIAIIGAIGSFVCMKKMQDKERQLVLDDIEIELKMCERYINDAEDKKDFKKIRELEKIQRNLQRQKQRIKYKMNVEHDQNVPNATEDLNAMRDRLNSHK